MASGISTIRGIKLVQPKIFNLYIAPALFHRSLLINWDRKRNTFKWLVRILLKQDSNRVVISVQGRASKLFHPRQKKVWKQGYEQRSRKYLTNWENRRNWWNFHMWVKNWCIMIGPHPSASLKLRNRRWDWGIQLFDECRRAPFRFILFQVGIGAKE